MGFRSPISRPTALCEVWLLQEGYVKALLLMLVGLAVLAGPSCGKEMEEA
jgi:hypothetical protein